MSFLLPLLVQKYYIVHIPNRQFLCYIVLRFRTQCEQAYVTYI